MQRHWPCGLISALLVTVACGLSWGASGLPSDADEFTGGTLSEVGASRGERTNSDGTRPHTGPGSGGALPAFSQPARQGVPVSSGRGVGRPGTPNEAAGQPPAGPPATLPRAMRYYQGASGVNPAPPSPQGAPPPRGVVSAQGAHSPRAARVQAPIVPDKDGSIMARVPGDAAPRSFRGYPAGVPASRPVGPPNAIGEFVLDSFAVRAPADKPEGASPPSRQPESGAPSFLEQIGSGIGRAVSSVVTGR